jgi:anti-sigma factor RsiW
MAGDLRPRAVSESHCDRARQWSSLRVDGELSELEDVLLEKHLGGCPECRSFEADLHSAAHVLRTSPVEAPVVTFGVPARPAVRFPVSRRVAVAAVAVAAVAVAAALGSLVGSTLHRPAARPEPQAPQVSWITDDLADLRQLHRRQYVRPLAPARRGSRPPEGNA